MSKQAKKSLKLRLREQWPLLVFLLPGIIAFALFSYLPYFGLLAAFKSYNPLKGILGSKWVGFENFEYIFSLPSFRQAFTNTAIIGLLKLVFCFPAPIIFALMINEVGNRTLKRTLQTISYLPHFISWVVAGSIWYRLLSPYNGIVNDLLMKLGILQETINFVGEPSMFRGILIISDIWKELGWGAIIYLAAITSINPELYEAAVVDGANRWQQVLYITLPGIKGTIVLMLIMQFSNLINIGYDQIYNMYNDVVMEVADVLDTLILRTLSVGSMRDISLGTAMGLFKNMIGILLFLLANGVSKKLTNESLV